MVCNSCNKEITNDSIFCNYCGRKQGLMQTIPLIVRTSWNEAAFVAASYNEEIIKKLHIELTKANDKYRDGLQRSFRGGSYILEKRNFKLNSALLYEAGAFTEKYFLMEGFTRVITPRGGLEFIKE